MIIEVITKDGKVKKYCKVVNIAVMGGELNDKLYIQTRISNNARESFIPLAEIDRYYIREAH